MDSKNSHYICSYAVNILNRYVQVDFSVVLNLPYLQCQYEVMDAEAKHS